MGVNQTKLTHLREPHTVTSHFRWCGCAASREGGSFIMVQMQDLLAKSFRDFREGSIVKGRVLEIRPREVLVDIGYKSEGVIPSAEFDNIDTLEVGDEVDVLLERLENDEGMVVLSKEKAAYRQNWNKIASVFQGDGLIKGKVKSVVKGRSEEHTSELQSHFFPTRRSSDLRASFLRPNSITLIPWKSATKWTCCSSVSKTTKAWSCCPRRKQPTARTGTRLPAFFRATA